MPTVEVTTTDELDGWTAVVTVRDRTTTTHRVRVTRAEHSRYGGGEIDALVYRAFNFLLAREPNTAILREFSLGDIEHYFPEFSSFQGPSGPTARG